MIIKRWISLLILFFLIGCAANKPNDSLLETISTYDGRVPQSSRQASADCESSLKLEGTMFVETCVLREKGCIPAAKAVYEYTVAEEFHPSVLSISMQASPWRLYDRDMRIVTIEELAEIAKSQLRGGIKRIVLIASWTGVAPAGTAKSLAQKLSDLLDGFPVSGMDGFVWIAKDGTVRTTHQAFTIKRARQPYGVHPGDEVMVSLVVGWMIDFEEDYVKKRNSEGILRAGVGWDVFMLCPDRALRSFEAAARLSNPIAAYNAALMRLERGKEGDLEAATALLSRASALGDKKARAWLQKLKKQGR